MRTERLRNEPGWIYIERPSFEVVPLQNSGTKNFFRNQLSRGLLVNVSYRLVRSACQKRETQKPDHVTGLLF